MKVSGPPAAPVTVTDTTGKVIFNDVITGDKTFKALALSRFLVTPGAVNGYTTPTPQSADLTKGSASLTLTYTAIADPQVPNPAHLTGKFNPWNAGPASMVAVATSGGSIVGTYAETTVADDGAYDLTLPAISDRDLQTVNQYFYGCGTGDARTKILSISSFAVLNSGYTNIWDAWQYGMAYERPVAGTDLTSGGTYVRLYATAPVNVNCTGYNGLSIDLHLKQGWNLAVLYGPINNLPSSDQPRLVDAAPNAPIYPVFTANPNKLSLVGGYSDVAVVAGASTSIPDLRASFSGPPPLPATDLTVTLENAPAGVSLSPTTVPFSKGSATFSPTISASDTTIPGTYWITVLASEGQLQARYNFTLHVTAPAPVLNVKLNADRLYITPGGSATLTGTISSDRPVASAYLELSNLPSTMYANTVYIQNVSSTPTPFSVVINSWSTPTAGGTYTASLNARDDSGGASLTIPVGMTVYDSGFDLSQSANQTLVVYAGETMNVPVSIRSINTFSGTISLQLSNLPTGVTQVAPVTVNMSGNDVAVNVQVQASTSADFSDAAVLITASSGARASQTKMTLKSRPKRAQVPGQSSYYSNQPSVSSNGSAFLTSSSGIYKVSADLNFSQLTSSSPNCTVVVGQDGGLWTSTYGSTQPYIRYDASSDAVTNYVSPGNFSGCIFMQVDSQRRAWVTSYSTSGVTREDLIKQTSDKVPGLSNVSSINQLLVDGSTVWVSSGSTLYKVNADTLGVTTYAVPGISSVPTFQAHGNNIYFINNGKLAVFDTTVQSLTSLNVANYSFTAIMGLDSQGNAWVSGRQSPNDQSVWVKLDSATGQVLRQLPNLNTSYYYSSTLASVAPDGGLYYAENNYILHVAP